MNLHDPLDIGRSAVSIGAGADEVGATGTSLAANPHDKRARESRAAVFQGCRSPNQ
jgi:hypothetical protein